MSVTGKAAQIPDALLAHLETMEVGGSPPLPIARPDITFDPATDAPEGKYVEAGYFRNRAAWEGLTSGVLDQGLLVLGVVWPKGQGAIAVNEVAEEVAAHFPKGLVLTSGATRVKITREPTIGSPITGDDKTVVPVTIAWTA